MHAIDTLLDIMSRLRDPESGCPWDIKQSYSSIVPYTLEEAYEVADAIAQGDMQELRAELGDLLFQVVFYSQIAREEGHFDFNDVIEGINAKMIRRHPHVFADAEFESDEALHEAWEQTKAVERAGRKNMDKDGAEGQGSQLDGIARALPALIRAHKLQKRASRVGFDWSDVTGAWDKLKEEVQEVEAELESFADSQGQAQQQQLQEELGDLLFSMVNVLRLSGMDAEQTLLKANDKFERRFRAMEANLYQSGKADLDQLSAKELDEAWEKVKTNKSDK